MSHTVGGPDPSSPESHYPSAPGDRGPWASTKETVLCAEETERLMVKKQPYSAADRPRDGAVEKLGPEPAYPCPPVASGRNLEVDSSALDIRTTALDNEETRFTGQQCSDEPTDKGVSGSGGSGGGQNSGSGGKKSGSESSNSSSQQSGSGSRSGGRKHVGSCSGSGSSGEEEEEDNGDKRRRPHQGSGVGKDQKPKLVEEDDEATDSADEGVDDDATPNSMIMDFSPPQSNQSENGTEHAPGEGGMASKFTSAMDTGGGGGSGYSSQSAGETQNRPTSLAANINHFEGGKDLLSTPATPLDTTPQGDSGTVSIESVVPELSNSVEPASSAINMIVGYGVPAASAPPQPASSSDKSLPGSELGTPTLDSPPPIIAEEKTVTPQATPATPVPVMPVLSPALSLLPQVCNGQVDSL